MWRAAWRGFGIALGVFSLLRLCFIFWNRTYLDDKSYLFVILLKGFLFDLAVNAWLLGLPLLFLLFQRPSLARWVWVIGLSLALAFEVIDIGFFAYSHRRSGPELIEILAFWKDTLPNLKYYLRDFALGFIFWGLLVWIMSRLSRWAYAVRRRSLFDEVIGFLGTFLLWGIGFRGGLGHKPLAVIDAAVRGCANCTAFVLNTSFCIVRGLEQPRLPPWPPFPEGLEPYPRLVQADTTCAFAKRYNVVILIVESLSAEYLEKGYAPFTWKLAQKGASVRWAFACNARSAEGVPAILSGLPSWGEEPLLFSPYADRLSTSVARYLKKWGYFTAFFHGGNNGTMFLDSYAQGAGFERYYGRQEYPYPDRDYDGIWGIWDGPFLQFTAQTLSTLPEPFCVAIFTLSSHHPYKIPSDLRDSFPEGPLPIHKSIRYADWALARFFERVEKAPWARRTLFVLTADHTGPSEAPYSPTRSFWVPLLFYIPGQKLPKPDSLASHLDIGPSLLEALGYPYPFEAWGRSVWQPFTQRWAPMRPLPFYFEVVGRETILQYSISDTPRAIAWEGAPWVLKGASPLPSWLKEWEAYLASYGAYISPSIGRMRTSSTTAPKGKCAMVHSNSATDSARMKRSSG